MSESISYKVKSVLADTLKIAAIESITMDSKLKEDLGLDSMSSLTFLMELEESIPGFTIDTETLDVEDLACVQSITNYVQKTIHKGVNHV